LCPGFIGCNITNGNPVPSQAAHCTSCETTLGFGFFLKFILKKEKGTPFAGDPIRPLPEQRLQGPGKILRPGWTGCITVGNPVPLHAGQITSEIRPLPKHRLQDAE
jgi:hypothetical protein